MPAGFRSSGVSAGIKPKAALDLGLIVADEPVTWAGTFTRNAAAAACVGWCRSALDRPVRAIVVNSGNANACTGTAGEAAVRTTADAVAAEVGCPPDQVLVASTGTIGIPLPVTKLVGAVPDACEALSDDPDAFARSIMTTDTAIKMSTAAAGKATVVGIAKGAAMLAPNMATMLAFITTDAQVAGDLQGLLDDAVRVSFDRICVDACESTNDSVFLLSSAVVPAARDELGRAVADVCRDLAEQMVRDAEGGSKLVRIQVTGTPTDDDAAALGRSIAASSLWRAAAGGGDPNWGRALAAMGATDRSLSIGDVSLAIGPETLFDRGEPCGSPDAARKTMDADGFVVSCTVGDGPGAAEILSCDLTTDYVTLNAGGTT